jgi:hypothetical protein
MQLIDQYLRSRYQPEILDSAYADPDTPASADIDTDPAWLAVLNENVRLHVPGRVVALRMSRPPIKAAIS